MATTSFHRCTANNRKPLLEAENAAISPTKSMLSYEALDLPSQFQTPRDWHVAQRLLSLSLSLCNGLTAPRKEPAPVIIDKYASFARNLTLAATFGPKSRPLES